MKYYTRPILTESNLKDIYALIVSKVKRIDMEDPKEVAKTTLAEGVKNFVETGKERYESPSSPWWNKVGAMAGPTIGGVSYLMTIDGIPKWVRLTLGFIIGFLGYWVPTKFGTTNKTTAQK